MAVFVAMELVLGTGGLYAVIRYLHALQRPEIRVRLALGASGIDVVRLTVGQAARLTFAGSAIGLALAIALSRVMQSAMLGIATADARIFAVFAAVLIGAALLAGYLQIGRAH